MNCIKLKWKERHGTSKNNANVEWELLALIISIDPHADRSSLPTIGLATFAKCTGVQPIIGEN